MKVVGDGIARIWADSARDATTAHRDFINHSGAVAGNCDRLRWPEQTAMPVGAVIPTQVRTSGFRRLSGNDAFAGSAGKFTVGILVIAM